MFRPRIDFRPLINSLIILVLYLAAPGVHADAWLPISAEELQMTSEPKAPGAPAIYLYRQVDRDDRASTLLIYSRIKILTEEGRKYADIEIPYNKSTEQIRYIEARTIRPDGSVVEFDGTVFEKTIVRGRGTKLIAKTFTLPDVQVGSIIEYRYMHRLQSGYIFDSHWILSEELFTKHAKFSLNPSEYYPVNYSWPIGLPSGTHPPANDHGRIRLETRDVPAFATEDFMPPENQLKYRVDFLYRDGTNTETDPAKFWKKYGKQQFKTVSNFIDDRRSMLQAVSETTAENDSPETKLQKLYVRAQQLRNLSFERSKTEAETERESQKDARDVGDVWKRGYGNGLEITWLFLGLARAAGFEADPVLVSTRDRYFFNERILNPYQFNSNVVVVKLDGKELFLDPGTPFTPYGLLPWNETAAKGLRLNKDGGVWVNTPLPAPADSRTLRKANLKLTPSGTLEGKVTVTYTGLEAFWRRLSERSEDEADRVEFLENQLQGDIPSGVEVKLTNKPDWTSSEQPLVAEYQLKVPGWASRAGQRMLLTLGLFASKEQHTFERAGRMHPLYFNFPYKSEDDITVDLPESWQISSVPQAHETDLKVVTYRVMAEEQAKSLRLKRELIVNLLILDSKYYTQLRNFYQTVRTHDEEQAVVVPVKTPVRR